MSIVMDKEYYDLIQGGEYYRLLSPLERQCTVWEMADPEGREALVSAVYHVGRFPGTADPYRRDIMTGFETRCVKAVPTAYNK